MSTHHHTQALLQVEGVTVRFGGLVAIDNVSFDVREGELLGLIGLEQQRSRVPRMAAQRGRGFDVVAGHAAGGQDVGPRRGALAQDVDGMAGDMRAQARRRGVADRAPGERVWNRRFMRF